MWEGGDKVNLVVTSKRQMEVISNAELDTCYGWIEKNEPDAKGKRLRRKKTVKKKTPEEEMTRWRVVGPPDEGYVLLN